MKKFILYLFILLYFMSSVKVYAESYPSISAKAAIVMDQETGRVLYEKILMKSCQWQALQK